MVLPQKLEGLGFVSKYYSGSLAKRYFDAQGIEVQDIANREMGAETRVFLYRRFNDAGLNEAGVYYSLNFNGGGAELLRFFSRGEEGFKAAGKLYTELLDRLSFTRIVIHKATGGVLQNIHLCCKCGSLAYWKIVGMAQGNEAEAPIYYVCDEHRVVAEEECKRTGMCRDVKFPADEADRDTFLPPSDGEWGNPEGD